MAQTKLTKAAIRLAIEDEMEKIAQDKQVLFRRGTEEAAITYARLATQLAGMTKLAKRLGFRCGCTNTICSCAYTRTGLIAKRRFPGPKRGLSFDGEHCRDAEGEFVPIDRCRGLRVKKKKPDGKKKAAGGRA